MTSRVFVYGSLRRGHRAHGLMAGAAYAGQACTRDADFVMVHFEWDARDGYPYPGVFRAAELGRRGAHIIGEVYEADDALLDVLDAFEAVGADYRRENVVLDDGVDAYMYVHIVTGEAFVDFSSHLLLDDARRTFEWVVPNQTDGA